MKKFITKEQLDRVTTRMLFVCWEYNNRQTKNVISFEDYTNQVNELANELKKEIKKI